MKFKQFFHLMSWYASEKFIGVAYSLAIGAILARSLGPTGYGTFAFYQSSALLLSFIINLGLDGIAAREIAQNESSANKIISSILLIRLFGFLVYFIAFYCFYAFHSYENTILFSALCLFHLFRTLQSCRVYFECSHQASFISRLAILAKIPAVIFATLLFYSNNQQYIFFYLAIDAAISGVGILFTLHKMQPLFADSLKSTLKRGVLFTKEGLPITLSLAMSGVFMQVDVILLKSISGDKVAGLYSVAMGLVTPAAFIPTVFITIFSPYVVRSFTENIKVYQTQARAISQFLCLIAYIFIIFSLLFGEYIITKLYGHAYQQSVSIFYILSATTLFTFPAFLYCRMLVIERKLKFEFIKSVLAAIASLGLNYLLIPILGATGAAISAIFSYLIADFLSYAINKNTRHIFMMGIKSIFLLNIFCCIQYFTRSIKK